MKKLIFYLSLLISFQGISYAMENEVLQEELSEKAQKVKEFLTKLGIDTNNENVKNIVDYFKENDSGIPLCFDKKKKSSHSQIKKPPLSRFQKLLQNCEEILFCHSLQKWKKAWHIETLRQNNCYGKKNYPNHEIDNHEMTVAIASEIRKKLHLNQDLDIPILKKSFCYGNSWDAHWADANSHAISKNNNEIYYYIETNSWLSKKRPATIRFRLAHEFAHLARGFWGPYNNLLITKIILGGIGLLISGTLLKDNNFGIKFIACSWGALNGIQLGNLFELYFKRQEEKKCDELAIKAEGFDDGVTEFFSLRPKANKLFDNDKCTIYDLQINEEEPFEFTFLQSLKKNHYSNAERLRYCKTYAEKHGYLTANSQPFNSYTLQKLRLPEE